MEDVNAYRDGMGWEVEKEAQIQSQSQSKRGKWEGDCRERNHVTRYAKENQSEEVNCRLDYIFGTRKSWLLRCTNNGFLNLDLNLTASTLSDFCLLTMYPTT